MAFNKKQVLENNIKAIEIALAGNSIGQVEREILLAYKSFGGIKSVLLNPDTPDLFPLADKNLIPLVKELHSVLQKYSKDEQEYQRYFNSVKNSILTSFYTPDTIVHSMDSIFKENDISINRMLDPSAGVGAFLSFTAKDIVAVEKDILTGKILKALNTDKEILIHPLEQISRSYEGTFDLVSSNIPFGLIRVFDPLYLQNKKDKIRVKATETIHNYFFLKGMDMLREGGMLAFITSTGVADSPSNNFIRKTLLENSSLVSAIRLPENLFVNTAGVEVPSDLIVLQKNSNREEALSKKEKEFVQGKYFEDLTRIVHTKISPETDRFGKTLFSFSHEGGEEGIAFDMQKILKQDFRDNYNRELYNNYDRVSVKEESKISVPVVEKAQVQLKTKQQSGQTQQLSLFGDFSSFVETAQAQLSLFDTTPVTIVEKTLGEKEYQCYNELRDAYFELKDVELRDKREHPELRKKLNTIYDQFILDFGFLNLLRNEEILKDKSFKEVQSIENLDTVNKRYVKSDIFHEPTSFITKEIEYTIQDALTACLNEYNLVNIDYISEMAKTDRVTVISELNGIIFYNPIIENYEIADTFLSGNVIDKLEKIEAISVTEDLREDYNESILALLKVIPQPIPLDEIGINLGERWIPTPYYLEFTKYLFNSPATADHEKFGLKITYNSDIDEFYSERVGGESAIVKRFAVQSYNRYYKAEDVFKFALKDITPNMTKKIQVDGQEVTVPDTVGIQKMNMAVEQIRTEFVTWLQKLPQEEKWKLETIYNRKFNNTVKAKHDGSFQTFPHLNYEGLGIKGLYDSQKDAISLLKNNFGGLIDHEVGGGKTLIACISTYELKRIGLVNKPMIIGIKANVSDIADTFRLAYPHAKVLFPQKEDLSPKNIDKFLAKIQNNNWDAIIMSHEQFAKIPQSYDVIKQISEEKIRNLRTAINNLDFQDAKEERRARKALESKIENLEVRLEKRAMEIGTKKSTAIVDFRTMGIDFITVDESHKFKNLEFETKHTRVAGLGSQKGSERAMNLLYAIRTIQQTTGKDFGTTFLSGTPISNSLTELYTICYYHRPKALREQGLASFDAWISTYAEKTKEFEFSITNEIIQKERFRHFVKVPELAKFYSEFTDYRTAEMIGVERPNKKELLVELKKTPDQEILFEQLKEFAKHPDGKLIYREKLTESEEKAKMLIATNVAKKASLDMRLILPSFEDHPDSKVNQCVENVLKFYHTFNEQKGTQFIFSDLGTFKGNNEWTIYTDIKEKLVAKGIPEQEVQFIQSCKTEGAKDKLKGNLNAGVVRVILGSTEMLGTGINAQERVVAIHHLDIPWRPSDLEQRNGRGVRKGNWVAQQFNNNDVNVLVYAVKQTLDVYKFNLLATKQTFITQIKRQNINVRRIDEGSMDEKTGMSYNEYIAALTGDRSLLEKCRLEKEILVLKMEEKTFLSSINDKNSFTKEIEANITKNSEIIDKLKSDNDKFLFFPKDENGELIYKLNLVTPKIDQEGLVTLNMSEVKSYMDKKEAGTALNMIIEAKINDQFSGEVIGSFYGFDLRVKPVKINEVYENRLYIEGEVSYTHNNAILPRTPDLAAEYVIKALQKIETSLATHQERDVKLKKDLKDLSSLVDMGIFPKKAKLDAAEKDLKEIIQKIERNISQDVQMGI